jgi:hypothetical protein
VDTSRSICLGLCQIPASAPAAAPAAGQVTESCVLDNKAMAAGGGGGGATEPCVLELDGKAAGLLSEMDEFLQDVGGSKSAPCGSGWVKRNRLLVERCQSTLQATSDAFTRQQIQTRMSVLEVWHYFGKACFSFEY